MTIVIITLLMMVLIPVGKKSTAFGRREWFWAIGIAVLQTAVALFKMFTMEKPPLY